MILGHIGIALGARALDRRAPAERAPLLWLVAGSVAPDLLDGVFALARICNPDGVYSHSLPAVAVLALLFGAAALLQTKSSVTGLMVAAMVVLHLPPDYVTGLKPLWPGGPLIGFHAYRWGWLDFLVEFPVITAGWWMLRRAGYSPRIVVSGLSLAVMLAVQASFDLRANEPAQHVTKVCLR